MHDSVIKTKQRVVNAYIYIYIYIYVCVCVCACVIEQLCWEPSLPRQAFGACSRAQVVLHSFIHSSMCVSVHVSAKKVYGSNFLAVLWDRVYTEEHDQGTSNASQKRRFQVKSMCRL